MTTPKTERVQPVTLPRLHPGQHDALAAFDAHRFTLLYCGRRWGKTRLAAWIAFRRAIERGRVWWIAPTFPVAMIGWRLMRTMARYIPGVVVTVSDRMLSFPGGGYIQVKSADNPDGLRGEGLDLAILDEAAFMREDVWTDAIRPALSDRLGKALFCTTPNGLSWIHDLYTRGQFAAPDAELVSLRFRTTDNPFIPAGEVEAARTQLPAPVFAQEYEAEPLSGDDGVIPLTFVLAAQERWREWEASGKPQPVGQFVLGLDVSEGGGDLTTFALRFGPVVTEIRDETPKERGDMASIVDKACELLAKHGGAAVVDSIGVGAFIPQGLRRRGYKAVSFKASAGTPLRDKAGEFGFTNLRAAAWWHLRELLGPDGPGVCLPPDVALAQELTAPRYDVRAGAKIGVEDKDAIRKRIGRSTDKADAVVQSFWDYGTRRRLIG